MEADTNAKGLLLALLLPVVIAERCVFPDAIECWAKGEAYMEARGGDCDSFPACAEALHGLIEPRDERPGADRRRAPPADARGPDDGLNSASCTPDPFRPALRCGLLHCPLAPAGPVPIAGGTGGQHGSRPVTPRWQVRDKLPLAAQVRHTGPRSQLLQWLDRSAGAPGGLLPGAAVN
jgi:hypothetical protein